jgi:hypothetical protein
MRFLTDRQRQEYMNGKLHPVCFAILSELEELACGYVQWEPLITCIYRTPQEDADVSGHGIHTAWRAVDIRHFDVPDEDWKAICHLINRKWIYDPARIDIPVAYFEPHGTGPHIHLQSHPATTVRR